MKVYFYNLTIFLAHTIEYHYNYSNLSIRSTKKRNTIIKIYICLNIIEFIDKYGIYQMLT